MKKCLNLKWMKKLGNVIIVFIVTFAKRLVVILCINVMDVEFTII